MRVPGSSPALAGHGLPRAAEMPLECLTVALAGCAQHDHHVGLSGVLEERLVGLPTVYKVSRPSGRD